jgi:hypothetical protein
MLLQKEIGIFRENMKCLVESNWNRGVVGPMFFLGGGGPRAVFFQQTQLEKKFPDKNILFYHIYRYA